MSYEGSRAIPNEQRYREALEKIEELLGTAVDASVQECTTCLDAIEDIVVEALR